MSAFTGFIGRSKRPTRAKIENFLEQIHPRGSALDRLSLLISLTVLNCPDSRETMIARAGAHGIPEHKIDEFLSGDVEFGFRWHSIAGMLKDCGAPPAAVETAHDLFHDFPRPDPYQAAGAAVRLRHPEPRAVSLPHHADVVLPGEGAPAAKSRRQAQAWAGENCSIFLTDIAGFSAPTRTDEDRLAMRKAMYDILRHSFEASDVAFDECHREDRGDGALVVISPTIPTEKLVAPLLEHLATELTAHNARASEATRFQLRVALHVGPVKSDAEGVNGEAIIQTARLVDAPALKQRLAQSSSCLGFITSPFVYGSVIKHRPPGVDPDHYQRVRVHVKQSRLRGWIYLAPVPE